MQISAQRGKNGEIIVIFHETCMNFCALLLHWGPNCCSKYCCARARWDQWNKNRKSGSQSWKQYFSAIIIHKSYLGLCKAIKRGNIQSKLKYCRKKNSRKKVVKTEKNAKKWQNALASTMTRHKLQTRKKFFALFLVKFKKKLLTGFFYQKYAL